MEQEREQQRKAEEEASAALIKQLQEREMELQLNDQKQQLDDEQLARQLMVRWTAVNSLNIEKCIKMIIVWINMNSRIYTYKLIFQLQVFKILYIICSTLYRSWLRKICCFIDSQVEISEYAPLSTFCILLTKPYVL